MAMNGPGGCENMFSAWFNLDPNTAEPVESTSHFVLDDYCPNRIKHGTEPLTSGTPPCYWKGPAFSTNKSEVTKSESHQMLKQRIRNQEGIADMMTTWDEVVIDAEMLQEELELDPAVIVPAVLYHWSPDHAHTDIAFAAATKIALDMQVEFNMPEPVPVIGVDVSANVTAGDVNKPFFAGLRPDKPEGNCCWGGCSAGSCKAGYCSEAQENCEVNCGGEWCDFMSVVV